MLTGPEKTRRVANFLVEIPFEDNKKKEKPKEVPDSNSNWRLYTDGASNSDGSRAGLMLIDPEAKESTDSPRNRNCKSGNIPGLLTSGTLRTSEGILIKIPSEDNETKEKPKEVPDSSSEWRLYTDGASNSDGSGAGLKLIDPEGKEYTYALRFEFETTNNE
ncbi:hypothetical protein Tco_1421909, partial [Tanacetum coccineum]